MIFAVSRKRAEVDSLTGDEVQRRSRKIRARNLILI
jgi:hypothetical protein